MSTDVVPVNEPVIGPLEREYVERCLDTGWISSAGEFIDEFEHSWASYCGMPHGVAVANGTVALELAVETLDLTPTDEVILPSFTIISCVLAVLRAGATPVLVDSDPETGCMDVDHVRSRITSRTRALMPVHMYGHPVDMDPLSELAEKHGLAIVEDAAEAHGAAYGERKCGGLGDLSCFSFYANKVITTGEGGMVLTRSERTAKRLRSMRNLCFGEPRFQHDGLGHNYRFTNLQAAIGVAQVNRIEELVQRKRAIARRYTDRLQTLEGIQLPVERPWARSVYWMYGLILDEPPPAAEGFAVRLRERGVDTRPFFVPMHRQPPLLERGLFRDEQYPNAERWGARGLYLPSGLALTDDQVDAVCDAVEAVLTQT